MKISRDKFIEEQFSTLYLGRDAIFQTFYRNWVDYTKYLMPVFEKLANDLYNDFRSTKKDKEEKNYKLITTMLNMFDSFVKSIDQNNNLYDDFWHSKNKNIKDAFYQDVISLKEMIKNKFGTASTTTIQKIERNIFDIIHENDEYNQKRIEGFFDYFGNTFVNKLKSLIKEGRKDNVKYDNLITDIVRSIFNSKESAETKAMIIVCLVNFPVICHKYIMEQKVLPSTIGVGGDISKQQADSIFDFDHFKTIESF